MRERVVNKVVKKWMFKYHISSYFCLDAYIPLCHNIPNPLLKFSFLFLLTNLLHHTYVRFLTKNKIHVTSFFFFYIYIADVNYKPLIEIGIHCPRELNSVGKNNT